MMAKGDNRWQSWLITAKSDENAKWLVDRFVSRPAIEFYDLATDPWELNNLADNPQYAKRIRKMSKALHAWMKSQGDKGTGMDVEFRNPWDKER